MSDHRLAASRISEGLKLLDATVTTELQLREQVIAVLVHVPKQIEEFTAKACTTSGVEHLRRLEELLRVARLYGSDESIISGIAVDELAEKFRDGLA